MLTKKRLVIFLLVVIFVGVLIFYFLKKEKYPSLPKEVCKEYLLFLKEGKEKKKYLTDDFKKNIPQTFSFKDKIFIFNNENIGKNEGEVSFQIREQATNQFLGFLFCDVRKEKKKNRWKIFYILVQQRK